MQELINSLKEAQSIISKQELIQVLNDNDVEYYHWSDIQMYIYYLENLHKED